MSTIIIETYDYGTFTYPGASAISDLAEIAAICTEISTHGMIVTGPSGAAQRQYVPSGDYATYTSVSGDARYLPPQEIRKVNIYDLV